LLETAERAARDFHTEISHLAVDIDPVPSTGSRSSAARAE
jgi:hypothetical protein